MLIAAKQVEKLIKKYWNLRYSEVRIRKTGSPEQNSKIEFRLSRFEFEEEDCRAMQNTCKYMRMNCMNHDHPSAFDKKVLRSYQ